MFNVLNSKKESEAPVLSNIRVIKIIAIILGGLIILGLVALFFGLANSYNSLEKKNNNISTKTIEKKLNQFNFLQPKDAQLISSSLGKNNEILLRYIYQGNNVLVVLDIKTKKIVSIITLKKEPVKW
jgi:hypothetical protein